jgi:hypothetical protein
MTVRGSVLLALRQGDMPEVTPVLAETAPKAIVVDIPFRTTWQRYAVRESRGSGSKVDDDSGQIERGHETDHTCARECDGSAHALLQVRGERNQRFLRLIERTIPRLAAYPGNRGSGPCGRAGRCR